MNRIIPQVNMQVVAQPHTQQLAVPRESRGSQITSALLGLAGEGLKVYDKHQQEEALIEGSRLKAELEALNKSDDLSKEKTFADVTKDGPLKDRIAALSQYGRHGRKIIGALTEDWNNAATIAQATRRRNDNITIAMNTAEEQTGFSDWNGIDKPSIANFSATYGIEAGLALESTYVRAFTSRGDAKSLEAMAADNSLGAATQIAARDAARILREREAAKAQAEAKSKATAQAKYDEQTANINNAQAYIERTGTAAGMPSEWRNDLEKAEVAMESSVLIAQGMDPSRAAVEATLSFSKKYNVVSKMYQDIHAATMNNLVTIDPNTGAKVVTKEALARVPDLIKLSKNPDANRVFDSETLSLLQLMDAADGNKEVSNLPMESVLIGAHNYKRLSTYQRQKLLSNDGVRTLNRVIKESKLTEKDADIYRDTVAIARAGGMDEKSALEWVKTVTKSDVLFTETASGRISSNLGVTKEDDADFTEYLTKMYAKDLPKLSEDAEKGTTTYDMKNTSLSYEDDGVVYLMQTRNKITQYVTSKETGTRIGIPLAKLQDKGHRAEMLLNLGGKKHPSEYEDPTDPKVMFSPKTYAETNNRKLNEQVTSETHRHRSY